MIHFLLILNPATSFQHGNNAVCLLPRVRHKSLIIKAHLHIIDLKIIRQLLNHNLTPHTIGDFRLEGIEKPHDTIRIFLPVFTCKRLKEIRWKNIE